jgi:arsenite-transporting ATPase
VELPSDSYFNNVQQLFQRIEGVAEVLEDPRVTSVRLVTNPERMVLRETQRAFVYFLLHGLSVDQIIVNRVLPDSVKDEWFNEWRAAQGGILQEIEHYFAPIPVKRAPLFTHEVLGRERLEDMAHVLYGDRDDPSVVTQTEPPFQFEKVGEQYSVRLRLPFAAKGEIGLFKKGDELVVTVGTLRRHIGLPTSMASLTPSHARLENQELIVEMKENEL